MIKKRETADPNSCLNKAEDDEPLFVIRANDPVAAETVKFWAMKRVWCGLNQKGDPKILEAMLCAAGMDMYHKKMRPAET